MWEHPSQEAIKSVQGRIVYILNYALVYDQCERTPLKEGGNTCCYSWKNWGAIYRQIGAMQSTSAVPAGNSIDWEWAHYPPPLIKGSHNDLKLIDSHDKYPKEACCHIVDNTRIGQVIILMPGKEQSGCSRLWSSFMAPPRPLGTSWLVTSGGRI